MAKKQKPNLKCDTTQNWAKATFIPKVNELIIYSDIKKIKVGDGRTKIGDLPFTDNSSLYNGYFIKEEI